jgi:hypothetical protein
MPTLLKAGLLLLGPLVSLLEYLYLRIDRVALKLQWKLYRLNRERSASSRSQ